MSGEREWSVGAALLARALRCGARSIFVVGTGKNVGKTVVTADVCRALEARGIIYGATSTGRDGEAHDALDGRAKPPVRLARGALLATARALLAAGPSCEIIELAGNRGALGPTVFARVAAAGNFELSGPQAAAEMRRAIARLGELGAEFVVVDGALDRIAALAGGDDAIVVATGAAAHRTIAQAAEAAAALVARLSIPAADPGAPRERIDGALTPELAREACTGGSRGQLVVRDPTQVMLGAAALAALRRARDVRCERPLRPIACTVAAVGRERCFDPAAFRAAVEAATGLPVYDAFAGASSAA